MTVKRLLLLLSALALASFSAFAQQADITLHSTVTGTREQPKVMYILPWQQPPALHIEQAFNSRLESDLFEPLDRDEFIRELNYQATIDAELDDGGD